MPDLFRDFHDTGAVFSNCGMYRWLLWRKRREAKRLLNMLMLNPSKAGAVENDPTVLRQEKRSDLLGFDGLLVTNAFGYISTDPEIMKKAADPVGPENDFHILQAAKVAELVVCAWGRHGLHRNRAFQVLKMLHDAGIETYALKISEKTGMPEHPLYIGYDQEPVIYRPELKIPQKTAFAGLQSL